MTRDRSLVAGIAGSIGWLIGLILAPREALVAWLVCWLAWGAIPIGSLAVLLLVSLIGGKWRHLYGQPSALGASLMPLVGIAVIPLLLGARTIYPWTAPGATAGYAAFKAEWLSSGFFVLRAIIYLGVLNLIAWALLTAEPRRRAPIAAAAVIVYAIFGSLLAIDFAETSQPDFHSSIYGLLGLTNQWLGGIAFAILFWLVGNDEKPPVAAAAILMTAILMWSYMHAMQYIVIWSGDIPAEARWYIERHSWAALAWLLFGLQGLVAFAALLSPKVRGSREAMMIVAGLTLVMRLADNIWLVLPGLQGIGWVVVPLIIAASIAMLGFGWSGALTLQARKEPRTSIVADAA
jgi:hypothetical protein